MAEVEEVIYCNCRTCGRRTRHEILCSHAEETNPEGYHERDAWEVIRCLGCWTIGFRHCNDDFEQVWEDAHGDVQHTVSITTYPRVVRNHKGLAGVQWLPELIQKVYKQTLSAYGETAYVLAGIGLRATIEAVCNHLEISGTTLERRIDQLFKGGYVSNADKKRLHAIRFLGNDAAHEIKEPKEADLRVTLDIVEHLLNTVFILERKARSLQTVIESYEEFEQLTAKCVVDADPSQTLSLSALLHGRRRLVGNNLDAFESQLKANIAEGKIVYLVLAQQEKVNGKDVQLYTIGDISNIKKKGGLSIASSQL